MSDKILGLKTMRGRAVAARRAHNPEVPGSSPGPATEKLSKIARLVKMSSLAVEL